jgi:hypothetical protein
MAADDSERHLTEVRFRAAREYAILGAIQRGVWGRAGKTESHDSVTKACCNVPSGSTSSQMIGSGGSGSSRMSITGSRSTAALTSAKNSISLVVFWSAS